MYMQFFLTRLSVLELLLAVMFAFDWLLGIFLAEHKFDFIFR